MQTKVPLPDGCGPAPPRFAHERTCPLMSRSILPLVVTFVCVLTSLLTLRTQAQYGSPQTAAWSITYASSGSFTRIGNISGSATLPVTTSGFSPSWMSNGNSPYSASGTTSATGNYTNTITVTLNWVYQDGSPATNPPPPAKVYLCEDSNVYFSTTWQNTGGAAFGKCDNGLKDSEVDASATNGASGYCRGRHLIQLDGSKGHATFTVTQTARFGVADGTPPYQGMPQQSNGNIIWSLNVMLDTRSVTIVSPALENGGNFHKSANNLPEINARNGDGSITVDSIPTNMTNVSLWQFVQQLNASTTGFDLSTDFFGSLINTATQWTTSGRQDLDSTNLMYL